MIDAGFVAMSRRLGADLRHCIAGGGNTSQKIGDRLHVKASGVALADIGPDGFVEMDVGALQELARADLGPEPLEREERYKAAILAARVHPALRQRPSVECLVHAVVPGRFVFHTHSTIVNTLTCCIRSHELAAGLFGDSVVYVPYVDPGFTLAQTIASALEGRTAPGALLMENHGLLVFADGLEDAELEFERVLTVIRARLPVGWGEEPVAARSALAQRVWPLLRWRMAVDGVPPYLWGAGATSAPPTLDGPLTPDQIVYCRSWPLSLPVQDGDSDARLLEIIDVDLAEYQVRNGVSPRVALLPDGALCGIDPDPKMARTAAQMALDAGLVARGAGALGGVRPLSQPQRRFIEAWEVESYRQSVNRSGTTGHLVGRVALVTGAAKGFGLGLSEQLGREGALVVAADLDEVSPGIAPPERLRRLKIDVADADSVSAALAQVAELCGGVDIVVSNAGILRAASVFDQSPEEFEAVNRVNYFGFFHVVRAAAPLMRLQRLAAPSQWFDIIQINSKSGLAGSSRNFAYAGSKFGSVGLVQSFALELVEHGVKVNAICPGNFFEGPLWSDPEDGLFAQYLRTGKVPGAKTIADVRRAYESKVPMGRGVNVTDVFRALLYLVEQAYETGQALPVTGGQVMR